MEDAVTMYRALYRDASTWTTRKLAALLAACLLLGMLVGQWSRDAGYRDGYAAGEQAAMSRQSAMPDVSVLGEGTYLMLRRTDRPEGGWMVVCVSPAGKDDVPPHAPIPPVRPIAPGSGPSRW
jgi:hypothetical protein